MGGAPLEIDAVYGDKGKKGKKGKDRGKGKHKGKDEGKPEVLGPPWKVEAQAERLSIQEHCS